SKRQWRIGGRRVARSCRIRNPRGQRCAMRFRPVIIAVLDGWGCSDVTRGNAVAAAALPHWRALFDRYPWTTLAASGEAVGLPKGIMGNSEVGHTNLGSGRVASQG